jgi:membrane complex biogenesis BtpA family protein
MSDKAAFLDVRPLVIAALHLPPFQSSLNPKAQPVSGVTDYALGNAEKAVRAGVRALYIQDLGDYPWAPTIQPQTVAVLSVVAAALRREFPDLVLGVCTMSHGAREPLAIAQASGAHFVRLKVYIGAMVKAEGVIEGNAHEAVSYRSQIGAEEIVLLADVYDRTGVPLRTPSLKDAATQAAVFGRADGLILTGFSFDESLEMLSEVKALNLGVPLLLGGGANTDNIAGALAIADGVIVSSTFKPKGGWTHTGIAEDWDEGQIKAFMEAVERTQTVKGIGNYW